jgi:hypothetical protein
MNHPTHKCPITATTKAAGSGDKTEQGKPVKAAGGKWDPNGQAWQLPYEKVIELGLSDRIVDTEAFK